jgi:hydroxymethylpyrimidine kinase/phosphomethylpyrimidine kinase/thiamine-phosphate diphosphorylase
MVWSIAGSDSGGGAGLQADLKAFAAFGVHGCTAVAAITAQNSVEVTHVEAVSAQLLDAQLAALAQDMPPQAIKTGLLGSVDNLRVVCKWVDRLRADAQAQGKTIALVVDPVLGASTGAGFADDALMLAYVTELLPRAALVTPNRAEAQRLLAAAQRGDHAPDAQAMAAALINIASPTLAVAITGGDVSPQDGMANDWLSSPQASGWLSMPRVDTPHQHGTGLHLCIHRCRRVGQRLLRGRRRGTGQDGDHARAAAWIRSGRGRRAGQRAG